MKRLRSFGDEIDKAGDKWDRRDRDRQTSRDRDRDREIREIRDRDRDRNLDRSSSYRRFNYRSSSSSCRVIDEDRESSGSRSSRRRYDYDYEFDGFDRRKSYDRHRDSVDRNDYAGERMHRSESFSGYRRDFGKGYELERLRREESVSSWRRLSGCKDVDEDHRPSVDVGRGRVVNVRSPQGSSDVGRSPQGSVDVGRSPQSSRDVVKSPHGSKDSVGGQFKTSEEARAESSSSSEMEEGELEPEPQVDQELVVQHDTESKLSAEENSNSQGFEQDDHTKPTTDSGDEPLPEKQPDVEPENISDENKHRMRGKMMVVSIESEVFQECHNTLSSGTNDTKETKALAYGNMEKEENTKEAKALAYGSTEKEENTKETKALAYGNTEKEENTKEPQALAYGNTEKEENFEKQHEQPPSTDSDGVKEEQEEECRETSLHLDNRAQMSTVDLQVQSTEMNCIDSNEVSMEEEGQSDKTLTLLTDTIIGKDKGKSVAISQSSDTNNCEISWGGKDILPCIDDHMEGPSSRGFELFSHSSLARSEKRNYSLVGNGKKLKSEPLDLSLALPNILAPLPSHELTPTPSSPVCRSVQSLSNTLHTRSDEVSGSMLFSGSQTFIHSPNCSLTQNSFENFEQSVGSHPLFQGADLQVSHILSKLPNRMESISYQRAVNENGCHASQTSNGIAHIQAIRGQQRFRLSEESSGISVGQDRESNLLRQNFGIQSKSCAEIISPQNITGSHETMLEFSKDNKHIAEERNGNQHCSSSLGEMDKLLIGGNSLVERIITMIIFDPVQAIARRIEEMAEQSIALLKESACQIILNKNKGGQLHAFQEALQDRSDLTVDMLSKSHRAQLEILVAFKTGLHDFLQRAGNIPSVELAEIYNNTRCRNLACLSVLPVDDCDCKICTEKEGFCSMCTCLICLKFDMALNTCSWVGCDVCLHWCHTDCALQMSFVKNGRSMGFGQEGTEMQFHCVACNHPSEMFGFVKEVFKTCAKDWNVETLAKELEYVKRIFSASTDPRGKQLHIVAARMIAKLEAKSDLADVYNHIIHFLNRSKTEFSNTATTSLKERPPKHPEDSNRVTEPTEVPSRVVSACTENILRRDIACTIPSKDQVLGPSGNLEFEFSFRNLHVADELESIIKIKQAEAKMFQARADEARKEAEGLKRIAVAKNETLDAEYLNRITKLRLVDAEEKRKQKVDELKLMEREHREYFSMKVRMESEIRVLLLKMEATKQNFGT